MSEHGYRPGQRASELRQAFDRSFAEAPRAVTGQPEDFLAVRVGVDPYAIRLAELSGFFVSKTITRLPNAVPEFLGIAGFRGAVIPVYDLRLLLGYSADNLPRWLVMAAAAPVALAFDAFEGHLRLSRTTITPEDRLDRTRQHVGEVLRAADLARPVVEMASILETIRKRARPGAPQ